MTTVTHERIPGFPVVEAGLSTPPDARALALERLQAAYAVARDNAGDGVVQEGFRAAYAAFYEAYLKE